MKTSDPERELDRMRANYEERLALSQRVNIKLAHRLGVDLVDVEEEFGWRVSNG